MRSRLQVVVLALATLVTFAGVPRPAAAAGDAERTEILSAIDAKVRAIGVDLVGFADAANDKPLDDALARTAEIGALIIELGTMSHADGRAADVVAHYPAYVAELRAAIGHLRTLKVSQHAADDEPARCAKDEAALLAPIAPYRAHPNDPEKLYQRLTAAATTAGERWTTRLAELAAADQAIATHTAVRCTASDAYWMDVSAKTNTATAAIAAAWAARYAAAQDVCGPLAAGLAHPEVAPLLAELQRQLAEIHAQAAELTRDLGAWLTAVRAVRGHALASRKALHDVLCARRGDDLEEHARDLADHQARELTGEVAAARATATALKPRIAALGKGPLAPHYRAALDGATAVLDHLKVDLAGRAGLKRPLTMARARRTAVYAGLRCVARDLAVSPGDCGGAACRVDCLQVAKDRCTVVEVRPDGADDGTAADEALNIALDGLRSWYARDAAALVAKAPGIEACIRDDIKEIEVDAKLATYDLCGGLTTADLGDKLPEVPAVPMAGAAAP